MDDVIAVNAPIRVAQLGCGTVGSHVARLLLSGTDLSAHIGHPLQVTGIAVRHLDKARPGIDPALLTTDSESLVDDADVVVEVIGGIEPARTLILRAMAHGASIVTANKALLAAHGPELYASAEANGVDLYFEAAVAGAIPIIRPLRESLVGDEILCVKGIVNGTTNFILDEMTNSGMSFADALGLAQELGFAEPDPTADVEGFDAAAKASLLASLGFRTQILGDEVSRDGITSVTTDDIEAANRLGYVIKLLACAKPLDADPTQISVWVRPTMVPLSHPLANVHGGNNAIFVESRNAGRLMFMGPGAGGAPTASAVLGDLVTVARNRVAGVHLPPTMDSGSRRAASHGDAMTSAYIALTVADSPGVLARIASVFAAHQVSISTVHQGPSDARSAVLDITTHCSRWGDVQDSVAELKTLTDVVHGDIRVYAVEGN
ncbi:MAG: homoserine dehydrogenase [Propionibacteriaceae bacterium]|jgi:homoserine dehydrogenase|nr:homoserine dehydrogenase [Propionibacteriaceae bacterium]